MEKHEYKTLFECEDDYWWYVGLRSFIRPYLKGCHRPKEKIKLLDAGCGTGGFLNQNLHTLSYGIDISSEAINFCKKRNISNLMQASVSDLPFKSRSFDIVICLDVLYHIRVQDGIKALKELNRVLCPGGTLILHLPAYEFLRSTHDQAIHSGHRFTMRELKYKLIKCGFDVKKISYRNFLIFPLIILKRFMIKNTKSNQGKVKSDLKKLPHFINQFLTQILLLENKFTSSFNLPYGLSLFCVAQKQ